MTNSVGTKVALTAMIATIHHMGLAWDLPVTVLHREDCLRLQGQAPLGEQHLLRWGGNAEAKTSAISERSPRDQL